MNKGMVKCLNGFDDFLFLNVDDRHTHVHFIIHTRYKCLLYVFII